MRRFVLSLLLLTVIASPVRADTRGLESANMNSANYRIEWNAAGVSGGSSASVRYKLDSTLGQMAANTRASGGRYQSCSGQQCLHLQPRAGGNQVYLPLIVNRWP